MSRADAKNWAGVLLVALSMAAGLAVFVAKAVAAQEVRALEQRVTVVETESKSNHELLKETRDDVKTILREIRKP